jgi:hypothetical protein
MHQVHGVKPHSNTFRGGEGGLESVAVVKGEVIVRRFEVGPRGGACCPDLVRIERWRWLGGKLVQQPGVRVVKRNPVRWSLPQPSRRGERRTGR